MGRENVLVRTVRRSRILAGMTREFWRVTWHSKGQPGQWLSHSDLIAKKHSSTLFILGSGSSINSYTGDQWQQIGAHDSLGLNNWFIHDFIPDLLMFELPNGREEQAIFKSNLSRAILSYADKGILLFYRAGTRGRRRQLHLPQTSGHAIRYLFNPRLPLRSDQDLDLAIRLMAWLQRHIHKGRKLVVYKNRASLFTAVQIGVLSGYTDIVLCGVDLNQTDYFFDSNPGYYQNKGYTLPRSDHKASVHRTNDPDFGAVTVSRLLLSYKHHVLDRQGIRLWIGAASSALFPALPVYWNRGDD